MVLKGMGISMEDFKKILIDFKRIFGKKFDLSDDDLCVMSAKSDKTARDIIRLLFGNQMRSANNKKVLTKAQKYKVQALVLRLMAGYLESVSDRIIKGKEDNYDEEFNIDDSNESNSNELQQQSSTRQVGGSKGFH